MTLKSILSRKYVTDRHPRLTSLVCLVLVLALVVLYFTRSVSAWLTLPLSTVFTAISGGTYLRGENHG